MSNPSRHEIPLLHSRGQKIAFGVVFVAAVVAAGLAFGWDQAVYGAAATSCLWAVGGLIFLVRDIRRAKREPRDPKAEVDWLAVRRAEVRVEGSPERYMALFEGTLSPSSVPMSKREQKIAKALVRLGLPQATVSTLDADAPAPPSGVDGEPFLIEIPELLV